MYDIQITSRNTMTNQNPFKNNIIVLSSSRGGGFLLQEWGGSPDLICQFVSNGQYPMDSINYCKLMKFYWLKLLQISIQISLQNIQGALVLARETRDVNYIAITINQICVMYSICKFVCDCRLTRDFLFPVLFTNATCDHNYN